MGFGDGFNPSKASVDSSTKSGGSLDQTHQFTGSVFITSSAMSLSASNALSASSFWTPDGELTAGGGGGAGIAFDGSTANGVATRKNATTASIESNFTFDGAANLLSVTGAIHHTGSHHLSGTLIITGVESQPLLVLDDQDASAQIGRTHLGYDGVNSDMAIFCHQDNANDTDFCLRQRQPGSTELNAKGSTNITFKIASATKMQVDANGNVGIGANYAPSSLLDLSGGAATFHIPDGNAGAFAISGSSNTGQGDPANGLYLGVNTTTKKVRTAADFIIDGAKKLWLGTGSLIENPSQGEGNGYVSWGTGESRLIIQSTSGSTNGIKLSGSITANEIASGSIAGAGSYVGVNNQGQLVLTASSGGGGGSPGGSANSVQVNDGASGFDGDSNLIYDTSADVLTLTGTFKHSGTLNLTTNVNSLGTVVSLNADQGQYDFNANFGQNARFAVTGTIIATGSLASGLYPNWDGPSGDILRVGGGNNGVLANGSTPILVCKVTGSNYGGNDLGYVGIGTDNPKVHLDIRWNAELATDEAGGDVVTFGNDTGLTAGALYYLNSNGQWASASAHATGSGNNQLLAIALGTTGSAGLLIRGWANTSKYNGDFLVGQAVYIESGSGGGFMSGAAPTAADSYARIVGYAGTNANTIYFNPGTNWVELS